MSAKELVEDEEEEIIKDAVSDVVVKDYSPTVLVSFRMPTPVFEALEKYREEHRLKRSEALNEAITRLLERKNPVDAKYIEKLIADSTKSSWGDRIFDIKLAGKLASERNIVGDENWSDEYINMVLKEYRKYAEAEELEQSDIEADLKFFASATKVKPKRVLDLYAEMDRGNPKEEDWEKEEKW